jgi:hypothetical protein
MAIVIFFAFWLLNMLVAGATIDTLWAWFVEPVFAGAPKLTIGTSLGLGLIVGYLTQSAAALQNNDDDSAAIGGRLVLYYVVIWVTALIYHFFFGIGA